MPTNIFTSDNNISIWYETFGDQKNPATLLMMGNGAQGIFWPDAFCQMLAQGNRFVIRYDYRDVGLSSRVDFEHNPYDFLDMAQDALNVLAALGIDKAHIVGLSMGGFIAQLLALHHPQKVLSLTAMMTSSDYSVLLDALEGKTPTNTSLPPMKKEFLDKLAKIDHKLDATQMMVENWRAANGAIASFDETFWHDLQTLAAHRALAPEQKKNHMRAAQRTQEKNLLSKLHQLKMPVLVIQGSEDPIFPPAHAQATAEAIPGATLFIVPGMGHALAPQFFKILADAILAIGT